MELSSGGQAPCKHRLPPLGECSRNPSVSVYQLALLWEAAFSFSEFFLKTPSMCFRTSWWVSYVHTCPHLSECSAVFDQKRYDSHAPPSLFSWSHPKQLFLVFPRWKKSSKANVFPMWKRWNKHGRSTKRHQNWWVQTVEEMEQPKNLYAWPVDMN